jgi:hypothetical protein
LPERLVEGATFGVGREAEGAGDGGRGGPCRGRHAGRRWLLQRWAAAALARFSSGRLRLRFCLGQRIRTAKGREAKRRRKGAGRDQEEAWVERSGSQEKRGVKAKGDLEKKARGSARRLACSGPRHGGAPNKYGGGGGGGGGAVVGGKEKKEGDGAGGTSAHGPDATRPEGGRGGRVPPRPRRSSQIRSAVWLVWSATGPRCRAVPCAQPSHARDPRGVNAAAPGVHARREWPYYPVGRAWARIASRRRRYPADRRTSAGAWWLGFFTDR